MNYNEILNRMETKSRTKWKMKHDGKNRPELKAKQNERNGNFSSRRLILNTPLNNFPKNSLTPS